MNTISTRTLSAQDLIDVVAVKVDLNDYVGKTGIIEIDFSNLAYGNTGNNNSGAIDLRCPHYNPNFDTPVINNVQLATPVGSGTFAINKYFFSVNNGNFTPNTFQQLDGTVDLLWLTATAPAGNTGWSAQLSYTLTWTDKTPSVLATPNGNASLHISPIDQQEQGLISDTQTALGSLSGWIFYQFCDLVVTSKPGMINNPPYFSVANGNANLLGHYCTTYSGKKIYPMASCSLFAVNQGKPDANSFRTFVGNQLFGYFNLLLQRSPNFVGDYDVTALFEYNRSSSLV